MIYTLPVIAAIIGWLTNFIAVKMLFHPREKVRIIFFDVQGIFPKRQGKLAEKLGKIVADELFSIQDIKSSLEDPEALKQVHEVIDERLDDFLQNRLKDKMPMLAMFLNDKTRGTIKSTLSQELEALIPEIIAKYVDKLEQDVDIEKIVYEKVVNFSSDKLEQILYSIMSKEFRFIELLGGILGFIIGIIQLLIVQLSV